MMRFLGRDTNDGQLAVYTVTQIYQQGKRLIMCVVSDDSVTLSGAYRNNDNYNRDIVLTMNGADLGEDVRIPTIDSIEVKYDEGLLMELLTKGYNSEPVEFDYTDPNHDLETEELGEF